MLGWLIMASVAAAPSPQASKPAERSQIRFEEVTAVSGLRSTPGWKYGGPVIADLDRDGHVDLLLGNHDEDPLQLFWGTADGRFVAGELPEIYRDIHGMAPGDYDGDGDLDLLVAVGGGNGKQPRPPILLRLEGRRYADVTAQAGLTGYGARGRSVRWVDLDADGDLDIVAINARQLPGETGPRNLLFENLGGRFRYRANSQFEPIEAERALVTDFNGDHRPDLVLFTPLTLLENAGNFRFRDVTRARLGEAMAQIPYVTAAAEADYDNDGDFDLYLARGKVYYEIADNAVDFDPASGRLDLRDSGNKGSDGIEFTASGPVVLRDFWHWRRTQGLVLPLFLGAKGVQAETPVEPLTIAAEQARGRATERNRDGWYLAHLGNDRWRLDWHLSGDHAWDIRASVTGVSSIKPDWKPQDMGVADILLRNDGDRFTDASARLPDAAARNNWGVAAGDFDNDGRSDFFLHHFGGLRRRVADSILLNQGKSGFAGMDMPSATAGIGGNSHGDMGAAHDFNGDGKLDLLNGDDDLGGWHLYRNVTASTGNWLVVRVGASSKGTDGAGAIVRIAGPHGKQVRHVGSSGEVHSQSMNEWVHFGLGSSARAASVEVIWRDGTRERRTNVAANRIMPVGRLPAAARSRD
jgi:hypothetical protein